MTSVYILDSISHVLAILPVTVDPRWDRGKSGGVFCCFGGWLFFGFGWIFFSPL